MDYADLANQTGDYVKDFVIKPLLYGAGFGIGYCLAVVLIKHPWNADLVRHVKDVLNETSKTSNEVVQASNSILEGTTEAIAETTRAIV